MTTIVFVYSRREYRKIPNISFRIVYKPNKRRLSFIAKDERSISDGLIKWIFVKCSTNRTTVFSMAKTWNLLVEDFDKCNFPHYIFDTQFILFAFSLPSHSLNFHPLSCSLYVSLSLHWSPYPLPNASCEAIEPIYWIPFPVFAITRWNIFLFLAFRNKSPLLHEIR